MIFLKKRFFSLLLSVLLIISLWLGCSAPVNAAVMENVYSTIYDMIIWGLEQSGFNFPTGAVQKDTLATVRDRYNQLRDLYGPATLLLGDAVITYDVSLGIERLIDSKHNIYITDFMGNYPYVNSTGDVPEDGGSTSQTYSKFISVRDLDLTNIQLVVLSYDVLSQTAKELNDAGTSCTTSVATINGTKFHVIMQSAGASAAYYCNRAGYPYVALYEPTATDNKYDYEVDDDGTVSEDSQIININEGAFTIVNENGDEITLNIDSLIYDTSTHNYTATVYNTVNEGDNYYYTYYTYNITYNITNTYITYIGSNDAYDKEEYQYYYQLPDGRSSADLTADDVAGMSFEFSDVVNYARSATDVSVRALYHFDGDTVDSSYFTTIGAFTWTEGASITYMEAPAAFDGALYLDNLAHSFDIDLPFNIVSNDFTLQFRYYQASEPDTENNIENFVSLGSHVLSWDEQALYFAGDKISDLPIGTWMEIAIMRNDGRLYIYLNGLCIFSVSCPTLYRNVISFDFGDSSRAFSMIDELRFLNLAIAEVGAGYTPSAVPHDSNLVLVLPDTDRPMADEHWEVKSSYTNLLGDTFNFVDGGSLDSFQDASAGYLVYPVAAFPNMSYAVGNWNSVSAELNSVFLYGPHSAGIDSEFSAINWGFGIPLGPTGEAGSVKRNTNYTFSIVHENGSVDSLTFSTGTKYYPSSGLYSSSSPAAIVIKQAEFDWGRIVYGALATGSNVDPEDDPSLYYFTPMIFIFPDVGEVVDVTYLELVKGNVTDVHLDKHTAVYSGNEIDANTAAVQSSIPVNGYTVGGVRPTLPEKGDCWFPVSENRIQTCYIYTGTMWEEVGCRWYTGSRWIPIYAFDLVTLEDLFDIADGGSAIPPITSEAGFWRWWQLQWLDFRDWFDRKFDDLIGAVSPNPGSDCDHEYSSHVDMDPTCAEPGRITYTCTFCEYTYVELLDATGHDWVVTGYKGDALDDYIFVGSIEECTDPSKKYMLPDGYIYAYREDVYQLPDGYTQIDYIESTGSQYLDTGVKPNQDTRSIVEVWYITGSDIFGARANTSGDKFYLRRTSSCFQPSYGDEQSTLGKFPFSTRHWYSVDLNKNVFYVDGVNAKTFTYSTFTCPQTFILGGVNANAGIYYGSHRYRYCELYDNGTLIRQLVPCVNSAGKVGMYDRVNGVFYSSSTDTPFVAGPVVEFGWLPTGSVGYEYKELTCSKCGAVNRDYGNGPEEVDLFDAIGEFLAEGIEWTLDKLAELITALQSITDTFTAFAQEVSLMSGEYPSFFAAFFALLPEELTTLLWFAVIAFVVVAVYKKWSD